MTSRSVQRANLALAKHTQHLNERLDREAAKQLGALIPPVSCTPGCAACCKQLQAVSLPEAINIVATYPNTVRHALPALREHDAMLSSIAATHGIPDVMTSDTREVFTHGWWLARQRCALLGPDDLCTVYAQRPIACRTYHVRSDPALCDAIVPALVEIALIDAEGVGMRWLLAQGAAYDAAALGPLPSVLLHAWQRAYGDAS
jgi:Fe-S-cluster containining protein